MKSEIGAALIAQLLDALKTPHVAVMAGMLGIAAVFGWVFVAYIRARK